MVYSYFQTREQAELWADSNLTLKVGQRYTISRVFDQQGALYAVHYPFNARR